MPERRERILIVDDEATNRYFLETALSREYETVLACDGFEAVTLMREKRPDLILLDVMMPGLSGFDLCRMIKSEEPFSEIPVIFLTALDSVEAETEGLEAGGIDFLQKPVNPLLLKLRIGNHLELNRRNRLIREQMALLIIQKEELERAYDKISQIATIDELTGLRNRRFFNSSLTAAISMARRHGQPLSVILADLDHFKLVNDNFGHHAGDAVLAAFGRVLRDTVRAEDIVARWGGEEFIILLQNSDAPSAVLLAERLRVACEDISLEMHGVTVSFGVTELKERDDDESFLARADRAMYRAKREGRNRVAVG